MSKIEYGFNGVKVEKPLIFYIHTCNHCQEEKIACGDFNRISQEGDSDG